MLPSEESFLAAFFGAIDPLVPSSEWLSAPSAFANVLLAPRRPPHAKIRAIPLPLSFERGAAVNACFAARGECHGRVAAQSIVMSLAERGIL
jgi:hypothetical protein